jgi:hypothetical protein
VETEVPGSFDDDDLRLANSQPGVHFYEWLGAIVLHHTTGYLSLVEKYEFARHPRKQDIVSQLLPPCGVPKPCSQRGIILICRRKRVLTPQTDDAEKLRD